MSESAERRLTSSYARGVGVVVARSHVQVVLNVTALSPDDERDLGMGLQTQQPIHDVHVRLFQCTGPTDVGLLVATVPDLDQRNDLLAAFSGADQRADDGAGRTRRPVQRLLDGENVGVA